MSKVAPLLPALRARQDLHYQDCYDGLSAMLAGEEDPAVIAAFLMGLSIKGEATIELSAACAAMQDAMVRFDTDLEALDIVGTGGDGQYTLNISTATALVTAACGVVVAKHGNRAASSSCGASDVLTALGVEVRIDHDTTRRALEHAGICFLWAPLYHPGMKHIGPVRSLLKIPTIFNLLGPLCNPAGVKRTLLGVSRPEIVEAMVLALKDRGSTDVWGVHGADGLDELSLTGTNQITALEDGHLSIFSLTPEDAGLAPVTLDAIRGGTPEHNARALHDLLAGEPSAYRDTVVYNVAAALKVAGHTSDLKDGVATARQALDSGAARQTLEKLIRITQGA